MIKAVLGAADGTQRIIQVPKPDIIIRVPIVHSPPLQVYSPTDSIDLVSQVQVTEQMFRRMHVDQSKHIAYYLEVANNEKTLQYIHSLVAVFRIAHPIVDDDIEKLMAQWSEDHPPHPDEDMWAYAERAYFAVMEIKPKLAKMTDAANKHIIDGILTTSSTQGWPNNFGFATALPPGGGAFSPAVGPQSDIGQPPTIQKVPKPKVVKPKLPPVITLAKGRMIVKRKG